MGHRSSQVQRNRPFKGSSKTKKAGVKAQNNKGPKVVVGKDARKDRSKALRDQKTAHIKELMQKEINSGKAPRLVCFLPVSPSASSVALAKAVVAYVCRDLAQTTWSKEDAEKLFESTVAKVEAGQPVTVFLPAWAGKIKWIDIVAIQHPTEPCSQADLTSAVIDALDICKVADIVVPVFADATVDDAGFGKFGNEVTSLLHKQGLPAVCGVMIPWTEQGSFDIVNRSVQSAFSKETRCFDLSESIQSAMGVDKLKKRSSQMNNFIRHMCSIGLPRLSWREDQRGYGIVPAGSWAKVDDGKLQIQMYARGLGFSTRFPVHITGVGDFPVLEVGVVPLRGNTLTPGEYETVEMLADFDSFERGWQSLAVPGGNVAPNGGVLTKAAPSSNDSAAPAISGAFGVAELGMTEAEESMAAIEEEVTTEAEGTMTDTASESYSDALSDDDWAAGEETEDETVHGKFQTRDWVEMEFPDEKDTPNDVSARQRFRKYRGLKSFKNSPWDMVEKYDIPEWYSQVYSIKPYKQILKAAADAYRKALETASSTAEQRGKGGKFRYMCLTLRVPDEFATALDRRLATSKPLVVSTISLLERKVSVQHYSCNRFGDCEDVPVPTKSELVIQCGFRRHSVKAIFSKQGHGGYTVPAETGNPSGHKLSATRYLSETTKVPGILSAVGPCQAFPGPALIWFLNMPDKFQQEVDKIIQNDTRQRPTPGLALGYGNYISADTNRLIVKRILLTGYPQKISGKKATISRMFLTRNDVDYFAPITLFTKRGRQGKIKEALGTHGDMKCVFSAPVEHGETVCLPLYKRQLPPFYLPQFV
ncbi:putative AARP2CN (NUC121) domain protein [Gregarina niphandrodes]|uniref:AARP2CN (NUC121) domain protein n=1 Tax=Gregarina niphandrodes TaxID=110365 RepID=A0A023B640_GRENI|nr:putative AARP2CN (NUC121) domain protein [Gregarina niphandrodes]EZG65035.1 putative AARP2CN (NUC121) domain protein [Gregarina niphandrodes]|eukprot:XP_011134111.1 putative AARP2CN (NUC121) domain protein [Gregarina niphandrodes]